jgi:hypothetical protein
LSVLVRFFLYNLLSSLAAGLLAWAIVMLVLRLLRARSAFLYASFLALPLVKSIFILLGMGLVFPWNGLVAWHRQALPPQEILPFVLTWFVTAWFAYRLLVRQARVDLLASSAIPTGETEQRLKGALVGIQGAYQQLPCCQTGETACCISDRIPADPRLLVSESLRSPVALVEGGTPVIIFPQGLLPHLDDQELALALAHELNHFALRKPGGWSAGNLRVLAFISPVALLLANALHHEEEKACDDLAVRMLGTPEVYASMLMKSYQFARAHHPARWRQQIPVMPELMGLKPFLSERIERLLEPFPENTRWYQSGLITWPLWGILLYVLFIAHIGT